MAAILNWKKSSLGIFGDFVPRCEVEIQVIFLKISAFEIFSRLNPNIHNATADICWRNVIIEAKLIGG